VHPGTLFLCLAHLVGVLNGRRPPQVRS
jgi:hypothetical protein